MWINLITNMSNQIMERGCVMVDFNTSPRLLEAGWKHHFGCPNVKFTNGVVSRSEIHCPHANSWDSISPYRFSNCAHKNDTRSIHTSMIASVIMCVSPKYHFRHLYFQMYYIPIDPIVDHAFSRFHDTQICIHLIIVRV